MKNKNKIFTSIAVLGSAIFAMLLTSSGGLFEAFGLNGSNSNNTVISRDVKNYTLTLNNSNKYKNGTTSSKVPTDSKNRMVEFSYFDCQAYGSGHVTMQMGGTVKNVDHILSINKLTPTFTASANASLQFRASYDGIKWGEYATLISGSEFDLSASKPYYVELKAVGGSIDLQSFIFTYGCVENPQAESQDVVTWKLVTLNSEIELNQQYVIASLDEDYALSTTQTSECREGVSITKNADNTININDSVEILTLVNGTSISDYDQTYALETSAGGYLNANSNDRLSTKAYIDQYSTFDIWEWDPTQYEDPEDYVPGDLGIQCLSSSNSSYLVYEENDNSFYCYKPVDGYVQGDAIAFYKKTIKQGVSVPVYPTGIAATDASANSYGLNDTFDDKVGTESGLQVKMTKSDGSTVSLSKGDFTYVVTDSNGSEINPKQQFTSSGVYTITVTHSYLGTYSYQINVGLVAVESVTLNTNKLTLEPTDTETLTATVLPANASDKSITWESDNTNVATVSNGVIRAVADGTANVIVKSVSNHAVSATCEVKVKSAGSVGEYTLVKSDTDLVAGDEYVIAYVGEYSQATAGGLVSGSGNHYLDAISTTVFSDDFESISELGEGIAEFTLEQSGDYWKFELNGEYLATDKIKDLTFDEGDTDTWDISVDTTTYESTIESTNYNYGEIRYNTAGSPRFLNYSGSMAAVKLYHQTGTHELVDVTGVQLNKSTTTLHPSQSEKLIATVLPVNASNKQVSWESLDSNVAVVDSTGNVTAIAEGTTDIKVTTKEGDYSALCEVTVENIPVSTLTLDKSSITTHVEDPDVKITATINSDATIQTIVWSSSDETIATVSNDGKVHAVSEGGPITITASADNGNITATCSVTVLAKQEGGDEEATIVMADYEAISFTTTDNKYSISATKISGTDPAYNATGKDLRIYANGILTISSSSNTMTTLVFNISAQGLKRQAEITCSSGSMSYDMTNGKVTWTGSASSVTFTVGEKADYGTDGNTKAGQFDFTSINVTCGGGSPTPSTPTLTSISVLNPNTSFTVGDTFTFGGTATAYYSNDTFKTVAVNDLSFSGYNMSNDGVQTVTVSYTEGSETVTTTYSINVLPAQATLSSITVSGQKTEFTVGDTFEFGGVVTANYSDGSKSNVTDDASFSGFSSATAGTSTITVSYGGKNTTYTVTIKAGSVTPVGDGYQITFASGSDSSTNCTESTIRSEITAGSSYISSFGSMTKVYPGEKGLKFGSSKGGGSLKMYMSNDISQNETLSIQINIAQYGNEDGAINLYINDEEDSRISISSSETTSGTCSFSPSAIVESITITSVKRAYLKGIILSTKPLEPVDPTAIAVSPTTLALTKGDTSKLTVTYSPTNANQNKEITWSSNNTTCVVVSNDGTVTAKANGNATITATSKLGLTSTCSVTVKDIAVTGISVSPTSAEISIGSTKQINATITPSNATNKGITWTSSNSGVATVDSNGLVTAKSAGSATITATAVGNTSQKATCSITVTEKKQDAWTIMIYMCGADLESESGLASGDIAEILKVSGQPNDVNIIIQTGGATKWSSYGISGSANQRYHVSGKSLVCDNSKVYSSYKSMGQSSTFADFITWGLTEYPAEKTGVVLWNHGGAMRGVCYDEKSNDDSLLNAEVKSGLSTGFANAGRSTSNKLEFIGYDACLMQAQDIAEFNSQYANYMIASQESEAGYGWDYDNWVDDLYAKRDTEVILKAIVDTFITDNGGASSRNGDQTLSYLNLAYMSAYKEAWESFASALKTKFGSKVSKDTFYNFMHNNVKYFGGESDDDEYFGMFDAKDFLDKIEANSSYNPGGSYISNVRSAFSNLVTYSVAQKGAGNANGLCCIYSKTSGNWLLGSCYGTTQTNFTNWRSFVSTYGAI